MSDNPIVAHWRGRGRLGTVFWVWGVAVSTAVTAVFLALTAAGGTGFVIGQLLLLAFVPYTVWILVSVWRCAPNTPVEWQAVAARWLTVAWAINAFFLIVFVEIDLAFA